jgi:hypothetical protein
VNRGNLEESRSMFCPVCKAEYRPGFTRCSDCDVDLVEALPGNSDAEAESPAADLTSPEFLWAGIDGGAFARITEALEIADIPFNDRSPGWRLLSSMRHPFEIWVQKKDHDAAEKILKEQLGYGFGETESATGDVEPSPELAEPIGEGAAPYDLLENLDPEDATVEVWSGEQRGMAQILKDCLRENGIGCIVDRADGETPRVLVTPESDARAREIIREVIEGEPPS